MTLFWPISGYLIFLGEDDDNVHFVGCHFNLQDSRDSIALEIEESVKRDLTSQQEKRSDNTFYSALFIYLLSFTVQHASAKLILLLCV